MGEREKKGAIESKGLVRSGINKADDFKSDRERLAKIKKTESASVEDMAPDVAAGMFFVVFSLELSGLSVIVSSDSILYIFKFNIEKSMVFHYDNRCRDMVRLYRMSCMV